MSSANAVFLRAARWSDDDAAGSQRDHAGYRLWLGAGVAVDSCNSALRAFNLKDRMTGLEQAVQPVVQPQSVFLRHSGSAAGWPLMAGSVSTRARQEADFRPVALAGQGQLSAKPGNSRCRPRPAARIP